MIVIKKFNTEQLGVICLRVSGNGEIPRSATNNLGEIPQHLGAPNPLF